MSDEKDINQNFSRRNWDALNSAEAFNVICQNRLFLKDEQSHILNIAALRLGEIGEFIATNFLQNLSINPHPDDLFLWARIQAVAEGLVFAPDEIGVAMVLPDGERVETYRDQAVFLFRYFAKWFLEIARDNVSGGEAVVADLKERAFLANDVADILLIDLKGSIGQDDKK